MPPSKTTSKRSPSILVTDVRNDTSKLPAPFVDRLHNVSVDRLLSGSSQVPSAIRRVVRPAKAPSRNTKLPPRLTTPIGSRTSKNSQRLVMIPTDDEELMQEAIKDVELAQDRENLPRCTSYCVAEAFVLDQVSGFLRRRHHARTRLYADAIFADYLLPLVPGEAPSGRVQSSPGDNRTIERMIDASEQVDHHFEFFSSEDRTSNEQNDDDFDPSEPQEFSPRQYTNDTLEGRSQKDEPSEEGRKMDLKFQKMRNQLRHAELFVFNYGVVVFWNFTEAQEKAVIADLTLNAPFVTRPIGDQDIETEEFNFRYVDENSENESTRSRPQIFNDIITLTSPSHMFKLAMSHAIAQSTKLSRFEDRMQTNMKDVKYVPKTLALTGKLGLKREQVLKMSGKLFKLRVDVNLSSDVLDTPDIFWDSEPSLAPLYAAVRQYLEIDQRILVINERCMVFLQMTEILADSVAEHNMDRITIIVIYLIVLSIFVSLLEIAVRFIIYRRAK